MKCLNRECGAPISAHERICTACGSDAGAPNVRAADEPDEIAAVDLRYSKQRAIASDDGYLQTITRFEQAVSASIAIICMKPTQLLQICSNASSVLSTFSLQVTGQARVPQDNRYDELRASVENAYFPNYAEYIRFGALSLSDTGHVAYGSCSVSLKDSAIISRASVFELPLFKFSQQHKIVLGDKIPPGHRASWGRRARLAVAKLGTKLADDRLDFHTLLLPDSTDTISDCIEVNIYGPLNQFSFEKVVIRSEKRREDKLIQKAVAENLARAGIEFRIDS